MRTITKQTTMAEVEGQNGWFFKGCEISAWGSDVCGGVRCAMVESTNAKGRRVFRGYAEWQQSDLVVDVLKMARRNSRGGC